MSNLDSIQTAEDLQQTCEQAGIQYFDAPLLGNNLGVGARIAHEGQRYLLLEQSLSDADKLSTARALLVGQEAGNA